MAEIATGASETLIVSTLTTETLPNMKFGIPFPLFRWNAELLSLSFPSISVSGRLWRRTYCPNAILNEFSCPICFFWPDKLPTILMCRNRPRKWWVTTKIALRHVTLIIKLHRITAHQITLCDIPFYNSASWIQILRQVDIEDMNSNEGEALPWK